MNVRLAASVKRDIRGIIRWIEERSPQGARTWLQRWDVVLKRLGEHGDTIGVAPEDVDHEETIRQIIFRTRRGLPYRALFVIRAGEVFVLRVRGPGQDLVSPDELIPSDF